MIDVADEEHRENAGFIKDLIATYNEAEDLINIGHIKRKQSEDRPSDR